MLSEKARCERTTVGWLYLLGSPRLVQLTGIESRMGVPRGRGRRAGSGDNGGDAPPQRSVLRALNCTPKSG